MSETATATPVTRQLLDEAREFFGAELIDSMVERGMYRIVDDNQGGKNGSKN